MEAFGQEERNGKGCRGPGKAGPHRRHHHGLSLLSRLTLTFANVGWALPRLWHSALLRWESSSASSSRFPDESRQVETAVKSAVRRCPQMSRDKRLNRTQEVVGSIPISST